MHGKASLITHNGVGVFTSLPSDLEAMRYHSLVADFDSIPDCLEVTAHVMTINQIIEVMGLRHKQYPLQGVQFHPESFGSEFGKQLLTNFLEQKA
jgi:anthranilate synthase component 2